jgi:hypothetical protein
MRVIFMAGAGLESAATRCKDAATAGVTR